MTTAAPIAGGQETTFASADIVLKPVADEDEAFWIAQTLSALPTDSELRVAEPLLSIDSRWVVAGWTAWRRLDGRHDVDRWAEAIAVGEQLHRLTASVPHDPVLAAHHPWAVGDRWAWGEQQLLVPDPFRNIAQRLISRRQPIVLPCQLIHGDLIGNVLYDEDHPPAVIDFSPFWRPARYATAIIVVDAIGWFHAPPTIAATLRDDDGLQLLIRAALFRLGSALTLCNEEPERMTAELPNYERIEQAIEVASNA